MATYVWHRRGRITFALSLVVAVTLGILQMRYVSPALATSDGSAYTVPLVNDVNPASNIVETTIVADEATVDIGNGVMANVQTFNGQLPGPEFRLQVGDTVIVHFENNLSHETGIHWHGIELENASDGTPLTQNQVPPGGKFLYKFIVPRPGVYWYHPHHHSSTNQVFKGLYGSIIVTDPNESALQAANRIPQPSQTLTLALSDITVCKSVGSNDTRTFPDTLPWVGGGTLPDQNTKTPPSKICQGSADGGTAIDEDGVAMTSSYGPGDVPAIQLSGTQGTVNEGQTVLTNGRNVGGRGGTPEAPGSLDLNAETYTVEKGQGLRLQIGNTATTRFFRLRLTGTVGGVPGTQIQLVRIGGQGGLLDHSTIEGGSDVGPEHFDTKYATGEILLDPGDRADVVAVIPTDAVDVLTLWTLDFPRQGASGGFAKLPTVPVAHFLVSGTAAVPFTIGDHADLRAFTGALVDVLPAATGSLLDPTTFSASKPGLSLQDIQLTNMSPGSNTLGVNAIKGEHEFSGDYTDADHADSGRWAKLGDVLELSVTNVTNAHHPFHLHGFSIQPLDLKKSGSATYTFPEHEFRDNINVPAGYTLRFRTKLEDRPLIDGTSMGGGLGRWVFHCHIFFHATFGMISEFTVVADDGPPPTGKERPYVNANVTSVEGHAGDNLSVHGTLVDTDSEAMTISSSLGSVTDNGDGTWTWTYTGVGGEAPFVYITVTDAGGRKDQAAFALSVNAPPVVTVSAASGNEGALIPIHATVTDPDPLDVVTHTWSYAPGVGVDAGASCTIANPAALDTTISCTDDGPFTITMTANDGVNSPVSKSASLTVANVAPAPAFVSPPPGAFYIVGTNVPVSVAVNDPGSNDVVNCSFTWDGGGPNSGSVAGGGLCVQSNTFIAAGVYTVNVTATDDDGAAGGPASLMIIVFDPNAGFITGGGTINSPPGAFTANPALTGTANLGITLKYRKGTIVPTGETEFQFRATDFNFHAQDYDWLVVAGSKAQYQGTGELNHVGNFGFLVTLVDGGKTGPDKFRIRIWDKSAGNAVVYDSVPGAPLDMDIANPQPLASGSVVIHE